MADHRTALVLLAKWPGSGAAKTRLASQLAITAADTLVPGTYTLAEAREWTAEFVQGCVSDLVVRLAPARESLGCDCILLYAPPVDEARLWFADLLEQLQVADTWRLLPVLASSSGRSSNLGAILTDAMRRARVACNCRRVTFLGSDCPDLPLTSVAAVTCAAAEPKVAAVCPASDGGYTLLALPAEADEAASFNGVHWSADDTCLSQLAALTRAGLRCAIFDSHADVDEMADLRMLAARLQTADGSSCPYTRAVLAKLEAVGMLAAPGAGDPGAAPAECER